MTPPPGIVTLRMFATLTASALFLTGCGTQEAPIKPTVQSPIPPEKELNKIDPLNPPGAKQGGLSGN